MFAFSQIVARNVYLGGKITSEQKAKYLKKENTFCLSSQVQYCINGRISEQWTPCDSW